MLDGRHARHSVISDVTQENKVTRTRWTTLLAAFAVSAILLAACGSDGGSGSASEQGTGTEAPEDVTVPDATVTAGLTTPSADMAALAARVGSGATAADVDDLFEDWEQYEGTVKANDVDTYLALEDALAALKSAVKSGDKATAAAAADDFKTAAAAYLAAHP